MTTIIQIAYIDLLKHIGINPHVVQGHSSGEYLAMYSAGLYNKKEIIDKIIYRSKTLQLRKKGECAVSIPLDVLKGYIINNPDLEIACFNTESDFTLSGTVEAIEKFVNFAKNKSFRVSIKSTELFTHLIQIP